MRPALLFLEAVVSTAVLGVDDTDADDWVITIEDVNIDSDEGIEDDEDTAEQDDRDDDKCGVICAIDSASDTLKLSGVTTSIYAHDGTEVPDGIVIGNPVVSG